MTNTPENNPAVAMGKIKTAFDAIHISKENGIMVATFAHKTSES